MNQFHLGRLIDHIHIVVKNLEASRKFYKAVLRVLGRTISGEFPGAFFSDELFVSEKREGEQLSHIHLAFQAKSRSEVEAFHKAALEAGGRNNGTPGERTYHPGYYAAFVFDPDGNNIEAVFHGPAQRSSDSVIVTPEIP